MTEIISIIAPFENLSDRGSWFAQRDIVHIEVLPPMEVPQGSGMRGATWVWGAIARLLPPITLRPIGIEVADRDGRQQEATLFENSRDYQRLRRGLKLAMIGAGGVALDGEKEGDDGPPPRAWHNGRLQLPAGRDVLLDRLALLWTVQNSTDVWRVVNLEPWPPSRSTATP